MILDRAEIAQLIPHAGSMCLLDHVIAWDKDSIRCRSGRHRARDNPLCYAGRLGMLSGIEFAAQAMAVHGRLSGAIGARPRVGFIVALRDIVCGAGPLDDVAEDLTIDATHLMGDDARVAYSFAVSGDGRTLVGGRATVLLQADMTA